MKTYVASLNQKPLWEGELPPIPEGTRLIIGPSGSQGWIVDTAYIHLEDRRAWQSLYVVESRSVMRPAPQPEDAKPRIPLTELSDDPRVRGEGRHEGRRSQRRP